MNKNTLELLDKELVLRESTGNIRLETTYCGSCGKNDHENIGHENCQGCGELKCKWMK